MIVRDEAKVIRRCLASVKPLIDHWVIVDTGSVDDTVEVVRDALAGVDGELFQREWRDFGHNRSEAIELAKERADYLLVIDADEELMCEPGFAADGWVGDADAYLLLHDVGNDTRFYRTQLFRAALPWRYEGVLHEVLTCSERVKQARLEAVVCHSHSDGARNADPKQKYLSDARVLQRAVQQEPNNARYVFYLAQSYRDAGMLREAIAQYRRRVPMTGFVEEAWYAQYQVGCLLERTGAPEAVVIEAYLDAYQLRPTRAEPLYELARHYRESRRYALAQLFAQRAAAIDKPDDILFLAHSIYDWRILDELAVASYWLGDMAESLRLCERLLSSDVLPDEHRVRVEENLRLAAEALEGE